MPHKEIPLTKGMVALVSEEDFEKVSAFKWSASHESRGTKYYAVRRVSVNKRSYKIRMHRFVMGLGTGFDDERVVDHLNDDPLDNRRENLEIITQDENMRRSGGWKKKKDEPFL